MALALFCSVLGAVAGNLGLMVLATGGVFIAGGIAPRILPFLQRGGFREAFDRKGRLHTLVERMPAYVVTHPQPGLLGAATIAAGKALAHRLPHARTNAARRVDFREDTGAISGQGRPANGRCPEQWRRVPTVRAPRLPAAYPYAWSPPTRRARRAIDDRFGRMVGRSPAMQAVFDVLGKASSSEATILLEGETGTGKEVSAEAIHTRQPAPRQAVRGRRLRRDAAATCSRASCSATSAAPSPARCRRARACSRRPTAARCSSTRSAS